jgi:hypothetical protein
VRQLWVARTRGVADDRGQVHDSVGVAQGLRAGHAVADVALDHLRTTLA